MDKRMLTALEVAEILGIGRTKVFELMASGELESVAIGRCRRVPIEALEAFVDGLRSSRLIRRSA
ncbi:MAG: helix-turn-helix domain-containing protein [Acidimicrobiales bacterium]|nr:helix-turn-helix domain-containing protein [Acidimicrobiales bacterium]